MLKTIPATFPNVEILLKKTDEGVTEHCELKDKITGDIYAELALQMGAPTTINGWTTEDLISIAIERLETLNGALYSGLNVAALEGLKAAKLALENRFNITSEARNFTEDNIDWRPATRFGEQGVCTIFAGYLFIGRTKGEVMDNIRAARIADDRDIMSLTGTIRMPLDYEFLSYKYLSYTGSRPRIEVARV